MFRFQQLSDGVKYETFSGVNFGMYKVKQRFVAVKMILAY
jgi:hypothetical protein